MKKVNRVVAVVSSLFSILVLVMIPYQITTVGSSSVSMTARSFPKFAAYMILICSILLFLDSFVSLNDQSAPQLVWPEEMKVLGVLLSIVAYSIVCEYIGFFLSTVLIGNVYMLIFKDKKWLHHIIYFLFVIFVYIMFTRVLYIHLPKIGFWIF